MNLPSDAELRAMFERAVIVRPGIPSRGGPVRIRSARSPDGIPCWYRDCWEKADNRYVVQVPHEAPRFPGEQLNMAFCSDNHRALWLAEQRKRPGPP